MEKRGTEFHYFIKKSQEKLTIYLCQNEKRLSCPDLFTPLTPPVASPLHWSLKAVCLSEILVALDLDAIEYERIVNRLDKLASSKLELEFADREYSKLMRDTEEVMMNCGGELDHRMFKYLMDITYRQRDEYFSTR